MAQTLVQLDAPAGPARAGGRPVQHGAERLAVGSGFTVGVLGGVIGVHWSLGISAGILLLLCFRILTYLGPRRRAVPASVGG